MATQAHSNLVRFAVLTVANTMMAVFCVVAACGLVEVYGRFRGACYGRHRPDDRGSNNL
jgi:hypothetical protein